MFCTCSLLFSIVCCLLGVLLLVGTAMEYTGTHRTRTSTYVPWYQCLVNHKNNRTISQPFESGEALAGPQSPEIQSTENMKPEETGRILTCAFMINKMSQIFYNSNCCKLTFLLKVLVDNALAYFVSCNLVSPLSL